MFAYLTKRYKTLAKLTMLKATSKVTAFKLIFIPKFLLT